MREFAKTLNDNALDKLLSHIHKLEDDNLKLARDLELSKNENKGLRVHIEILEENCMNDRQALEVCQENSMKDQCAG